MFKTSVSKQSKTGITGTNRQLLIIEKRNVNCNRSRLQWRLVEVSDMEGMTQSVGIVTCCLHSLVHMVPNSLNWLTTQSKWSHRWNRINRRSGSIRERACFHRERERTLVHYNPKYICTLQKTGHFWLRVGQKLQVCPEMPHSTQTESGWRCPYLGTSQTERKKAGETERERDWEMACLLSIWRGQRALW